MPPTLLAPDRQSTWAPRWVLESVALPQRYYATTDLAFPVTVGGDPFIGGDSDVGGEDLVGGGAGSGDRPAHGDILNAITITQRLVDLRGGQIDVPEFEVELANRDGALQGDYTGSAGQLWRYDEVSRLVLPAVVGVVSMCQREQDRYRLRYTGFDLAIFEGRIPKGLITLAEFPLAAPDAVGKPAPLVFGNVTNLPLLTVRDDQAGSEFDKLLCRDTAAALTGLRRVTPGGTAPFVAMTFEELEPYPGMDGVLRNGNLEGWDAGAASPPDDWTLSGAGATVAKNITAGQVDEGAASASLTRVGTDCFLNQELDDATAALGIPIEWWRGREITVTVRVRATVASRAFLRVTDNITILDSAFHTGGGAFETLVVGTVVVPCIIGATAAAVRIQLRVSTGDTTAQFDRVRIFLKAKTWNECLRPDLYPGYTAIRTFFRQEEETSGAPYALVADVRGLQPARNPIRAISTLLSHPTAGLACTVDPVTFAAMETALCLTYEDAITLDGPEVFLPFRDAIADFAASTSTLLDRSGHARHGLYTWGPLQTTDNFYAFGFGISGAGNYSDAFLFGAGDGDWISIPDDPAFSGQAITVELWLEIRPGNLPDVNPYPLFEKTIAGVSFSQYALWRQNNTISWAVRCADTNLYAVSSPLVDGTDENRWMHIVCTAEGGVLQIFRDGVLAATGTYAAGGDIMEGSGEILIAKFGTPSGAILSDDVLAKPALYSHVLSADRVAAHYAARLLDADVPVWYDALLEDRADLAESWRCDDTQSGSMAGVNASGTWNGAPTQTVCPLSPELGYANSGGAALFDNTIAKYGIVTGLTLALPAGSVLAFYSPTTLKANAGIVEKAIGAGAAAARDTQWSLCQRSGVGAKVVRFTLVTSTGTFTIDAPLLPEDVGRHGFFVARWGNGVLRIDKNGATVATGAYTGTPTSGVGDLLVGIQGTVAGVRTRPGQGSLGRIAILSAEISDADIARLWLEATWFNGGLCVDAALTEPRQAQDVLRQICSFRGIRFGVTAEGAITVAADIAAPTTIRLEARDGVGDGELTLIDLRDRTRPPPVKTVIVRGRRDLLSGAWGVERRRAVHTQGEEDLVELDVARALPTLDRIASYRAARLALDETVTVRLTQEARQLREGELVQVTDAHAGYAGAVLEAHAVTLGLEEVGAVLRAWDEDIYDYVPESFPVNASE